MWLNLNYIFKSLNLEVDDYYEYRYVLDGMKNQKNKVKFVEDEEISAIKNKISSANNINS